MLCLGTVGIVACGSDNVTTPKLPPLSDVRFINALADTGAVDIRAVDQVNLSPVANNLAFRSSTVYYPTEAGSRHFRVFLTSKDITVTSKALADAIVTLPANTRLTLLLTGNARAGQINLWVINDASDPPASGQIAVRLVNTSPGPIDGYLVTAVTDPISGTPTFPNVGSITASPYVARAAGAATVRVTDVGSPAINATMLGPAAPTTPAGEKPAAGTTSQGTVFSVYYFPAGAAGSANAPFSSPAMIWFVDRNPCDQPAVAACTP